jgi:hypothetical protein
MVRKKQFLSQKVYRFGFETEENVANFIEKSSGKGYIKGLKNVEQLRPRRL